MENPLKTCLQLSQACTLPFFFFFFPREFAGGGLSAFPWPPGLSLERHQKPPLNAVGIAYPSREG